MFCDFNEATQLKTSLAKYSIEFNDLAVQMRPHRIAYLRPLGRPYTLLYVRRSVGRLDLHIFKKSKKKLNPGAESEEGCVEVKPKRKGRRAILP